MSAIHSIKPITNIAQSVAIQGVRGAFHEIAARKFFGADLQLEMCDSFPLLFRSMKQGKASYGVVAIENTVAGTILPNYALLRNSSFTIIGEVFLRIEHQLMVLPGQQLADIQEVYSHPMAIQQCQDYFEAYPDIRLIEYPDTAGAAEWIQQTNRKGSAAIASRLAAGHYGMEIIAEGIETDKRNFTRFLIILEQEAADQIDINPEKASLCFNLLHKVGNLSQILLVLGSHGMNLTKIQSLPLVGREWEYFFHIDLEFEEHAQYQRALSAIFPLVNEMKILGEYPKGDKRGILPE